MKYQNNNIGKQNERCGAFILRSFIDALSWESATKKISGWAENYESRYICICNVHSIATAVLDLELQKAINHADMATPDGMPVALTMRILGYLNQKRISGPDLMWRYCRFASENSQKIFLYGSTPETLERLTVNLKQHFSALQIVGTYSPPFGEMSSDENQKIEKIINNSGANIVFVGLGCPKQEKWMAAKKEKINSVMIGVGAAFDFNAKMVKRAPEWMQRNGLEWLYRLICEPRRLWKRYLLTNSLFIIGVILQLAFRLETVVRGKAKKH